MSSDLAIFGAVNCKLSQHVFSALLHRNLLQSEYITRFVPHFILLLSLHTKLGSASPSPGSLWILFSDRARCIKVLEVMLTWQICRVI